VFLALAAAISASPIREEDDWAEMTTELRIEDAESTTDFDQEGYGRRRRGLFRRRGLKKMMKGFEKTKTAIATPEQIQKACDIQALVVAKLKHRKNKSSRRLLGRGTKEAEAAIARSKYDLSKCCVASLKCRAEAKKKVCPATASLIQSVSGEGRRLLGRNAVKSCQQVLRGRSMTSATKLANTMLSSTEDQKLLKKRVLAELTAIKNAMSGCMNQTASNCTAYSWSTPIGKSVA